MLAPLPVRTVRSVQAFKLFAMSWDLQGWDEVQGWDEESEKPKEKIKPQETVIKTDDLSNFQKWMRFFFGR